MHTHRPTSHNALYVGMSRVETNKISYSVKSLVLAEVFACYFYLKNAFSEGIHGFSEFLQHYLTLFNKSNILVTFSKCKPKPGFLCFEWNYIYKWYIDKQTKPNIWRWHQSYYIHDDTPSINIQHKHIDQHSNLPSNAASRDLCYL